MDDWWMPVRIQYRLTNPQSSPTEKSLITVTTERAWWGILVQPGVVTISGVQWSDVRAGYRAADRAKPGLDTGHNQYFILILYAATTTTTLYYKKRLNLDSNTMSSNQGVRERAQVPQLAHLQCFSGRTGRTHGITAGYCVAGKRAQYRNIRPFQKKVSNTRAFSRTPW